jgi:hypothetical protein
MILLFCALAFAGTADRYPWQAEVVLPAAGVARISVPPELRSAEDPEDGRDFLLVDAEGRTVPFAVVRGKPAKKSDPFVLGGEDSVAPLVTWADTVPHTYWIKVADRPIDALSVKLPRSPSAATVVVSEERDGGLVEVTREVVWRLSKSGEPNVDMPPRLGTYQVRLEPLTPLEEAPDFQGVRFDGPQLEDDTVRVPVESQQLQENGWMRYDLRLPQRYPLRWVALDPTDDLFDRQASAVVPIGWSDPESLPPHIEPGEVHQIRRLKLGGAQIDRTRLPAPDRRATTVAVLVESQDRMVLEVPDAVVGFPGQELVVRDAGKGPHTLYAGDASMHARPSDLQFASAELVRGAAGPIRPGARSGNPAYQPPEVRGALGLPGVPLARDRSDFARDVKGEPGLGRIPLDLHVLSHARRDLGDLRLLASGGAQIPYTLVSAGSERGWTGLEFERTERGGTSVLEVTLPEPNVMLGTITLHTDAPLFRRVVRVSEPRGGVLHPLRSYTWVGEDRPGALALDLHQRLSTTLVVEILNGDDPPLPMGQIDADWPSWELIAVLPEGEAELRYGDARLRRPDYDLQLLGDDLTLRAEARAKLGEVRELGAPALHWFDRIAVLGGIGVLGLGLFGLTGLLLLGPVPKEEEDDEGPGEDADPAVEADPAELPEATEEA